MSDANEHTQPVPTQAEAPAADSREERARMILQTLRIVVRSVQAHSRWVEKQCGVSATQLWALWELFAEPGRSLAQLGAALSIHPSTASNLVDKLRKKRLVRKQRSGPDQRVVRLYITPAGSELLALAPRPAQGALIDALRRLPDQSLMQIGDGLADLLAAMRIKDTSAALQPLSESGLDSDPGA
ncbi:MAG: winged helix-turn-helix transcriptional regulator [Gammaproteobacteria bacterium]|nr:winged helix-turn-helix transcriptional regulator [Gammaproteobacteria bacterium]